MRKIFKILLLVQKSFRIWNYLTDFSATFKSDASKVEPCLINTLTSFAINYIYSCSTNSVHCHIIFIWKECICIFPQVPGKVRSLRLFKMRRWSTEISYIPLRIFRRSRCQIQVSWLVATPRPFALSSSSTFQTLLSLKVRHDNFELRHQEIIWYLYNLIPLIISVEPFYINEIWKNH